MTAPKRNKPKLFKPSKANYQRAMRALIDILVEDNFNRTQFYSDHIEIEATGGFYGEYYHHLDYPEHYEEYELFLANPEYYEDLCYGNRANVYAEISREIIDVYRKVMDAFDDPIGKGEFDYLPIELDEDSGIRYSWALRMLANNLIQKNFDPFAFSPDASDDFNVKVSLEKDVYLVIANMRKN